MISEILTKAANQWRAENQATTYQHSRTKATTTKCLDEDMSSNVHEKQSADECSSIRASQVSDSECPREPAAVTGCALKA